MLLLLLRCHDSFRFPDKLCIDFGCRSANGFAALTAWTAELSSFTVTFPRETDVLTNIANEHNLFLVVR